MSELYLPYIYDGLYESWKFIGWQKLNDMFEEANYFEELHQDNDQVWQGEITWFFLFFYSSIRLLESQN
jgi:hypothetical protein